MEHKVVFLRDQGHLDDRAQIAFGERLGPLTTAHPTVNTGSAYERLHPQLKALVDNLWAVHSNDYDYVRPDEAESTDDVAARRREEFVSTIYRTEHPVVRIHPETGERALVLGHFVKHFTGLNQKESAILFNLLQDRVTALENTVRWHWQQGDVAIWDNRATQHYAVADFDEQAREVRRVTVQGDVPVSPDGAHSKVVEGSAEVYNRLDELIS